MLEKYLGRYAKDHSLTKRETEILKLLTKNITHLKEMAAHLNLSQSTINNHLNNIYVKCKVKGKAQLLAGCFEYINQNLTQPKKKFIAPNVLVVDDEVELCALLKDYLEDIGFSVITSVDSTRVMDILAKEPIDIILSDINMPKLDGFELLKQVRSQYKEYPVFMFMTGYTKYKNKDLYDSGASIIIDKPIDFNMLFYQMMQFYLEDMTENGRMLRVSKDIRCKVNHKFDYSITNISMGGVFVNVPHEAMSLEEFDPGQIVMLSFQVDLNQSPTNIRAKVLWKREQEINGLGTGLGLRFIDLTENDHRHIEKFIRVNKILDLIPMEHNRLYSEN